MANAVALDLEVSPLEFILERAARLRPISAAIVDPIDALSLGGALAAAERALITPILIGERDRISETAARCGWTISGLDIVSAPAGEESAKAVELASRGAVETIVKGALHSDTLLHAVLASHALLNHGRLSHIVVSELPGRATPILLSDGAVNISPNLDVKAQIVQNAIDVARVLGINSPRVAILAAVETVVSAMRATLDAAALSEMASRAQITDGIVDGPLALDDAISSSAATAKAIRSPIGGRADILISPDLQAGNILYKAFDVLLHARFGAVIAGASIPIVFTSRADSVDSRVISCAIARLLVEGAFDDNYR